MTSKLTREQATDTEIQMLIDSHEKGTAMFMRTDAYYFMAKELQERRKAAMDSEPVAEVCEDYAIRYISSGPAPKEGLHPGDKLYRHAQQPVVPATLPCSVELKPGLIIGKGCKTETLLTALRRRADYNADIDAMTPEERAEHDASMKAFKAMLAAAPQEVKS
ncbi:hypothetical protein ACQJ21_27250 [Klebsiella michiganensis]|uniref:hypothetical protein n=1 Tax=Klebsiella michiganensis TaxID=1134687 RepID=UPI003D00D299